MKRFRAKHPTPSEEQGMKSKFPFNKIGTSKVCNFYTTDPAYDKTGLTFRAAFVAADKSSNHKELCAHVGSMLCAISESLRYSVVEALREVGIKPHFVELTTQAHLHGIFPDSLRQMEWPLILTNFACMFIFIFVKHNSEEDFKSFMSTCVDELQKMLVVEPGIDQFDVPLNFSKASAIRSMLGASLTLRETLINFIMGNMNEERAKMDSVCQYLFNVLSWSGMGELVLMNERLVMPESPVLREPQHLKEAENLCRACAAIESHPYPQFFMHLASKKELMKVDLSRFPNLIDIAKKTKTKSEPQSCGDDSAQPKMKVKLERQ